MKSRPPALATFLENTTTFFRADLYSFTLPSGAVLRWSGATVPVKASIQVQGITTGPYSWLVGPPIGDAGVQSARGVSPGSVDITINCGDGRFEVGGVDVRDFVFGLGLDGALVRIDRAYAASVSDMTTIGPVGTFCRFLGYVSEPKELGATQAVVTCNDWRAVLSTDYPNVAFQTSCNNVFGDAKCGVNVPALAVTGAAGNGTLTPGAFGSSLAKGDGYFNLGVVTFTSGVNAGISRSVKQYSGAHGMVILASPLPTAPAFNDAFTITPGCPLSCAACQSWQTIANPPLPWQQRFRGTPFVPPPSTGLPT